MRPEQNPKTAVPPISRREAVRRAAVATGAAWVIPVLQTVNVPAYAQVSPRECGCEFFPQFVRLEDGNWTCQGRDTRLCPIAESPTPNCVGTGCDRLTLEVLERSPNSEVVRVCFAPGCNNLFSGIQLDWPCVCRDAETTPEGNCLRFVAAVEPLCDPPVFPNIAFGFRCNCA
jgi:hypothetical protein